MSASSLPLVAQLLHSLNVGGAEMLAARIARGLRDQFRFAFFCLDEMGTLGKELVAEGFPVEVMGRSSGIDLRCSWRLARAMRGAKVDVIQAHQYTPFFYGITARLVYRRPAILFTEHGRTFPDYPRPKRKLANRLLLEKRDRVSAVGEAVRRALIANEGLEPERVDVIYNGIRVPPALPTAEQRSAARREMKIEESDFLLIQVARLDALKDHGTALRTMERLIRQRPEARLVLVGDGPEEDELRRFVRDRALDSCVRFLGLRLDVPALLPGADVLLLTSVSEGIPLTILEGMAQGLPILSTDVGGVAEVVQHGVCGLLAPARDDAMLAQHALQLARDPSLVVRLGKASRQRVEERFSHERMFAEYAALLNQLLGRGKTGGDPQ